MVEAGRECVIMGIRTLPAQSSGLAIRFNDAANQKFQTGWDRNFVLERREFEFTLATRVHSHRPYSRSRVAASVCATVGITVKNPGLICLFPGTTAAKLPALPRQ